MARGIRYTTEEYFQKIDKIHNGNIELLEEYVNAATKILVRCKKHNCTFKQAPWSLLRGSCGCPECRTENNKKIKHEFSSKRWDTQSFIARAQELHGDKYDYSKVDYKNYNTKVCIICPEHGEFWQTPNNHISSHNCNGCPECAKNKFRNYQRFTKEQFIEKARAVHGDKYDYSKVEYINDNTKVCIICPEHGEFWQRPGKHTTSGHGCPYCLGGSKANEFIKELLEQHNIEFESEKCFDDLKGYNNGHLRFDFYIDSVKTAIEFDGYFHFNIVEGCGGEQHLKEQQYNDRQKDEWCKNNNINLIRISSIERRFTDSDKENIIDKLKFLWEKEC